MWTPSIPLAELPADRAVLFKHDSWRVALFRDGDGAFAIDDRCPHQGYPLTQGSRCGDVLTCCWHNWKFDLRDGRCLLGEDAVARYATRVRDGVVEVDLLPPQPDWRALTAGMLEHQVGRIARDTVRLLDRGVSPAALARFGIQFDLARFEDTPGHGPAVLVDLLAWADRHDPALCLAQGLEVVSFSQVRRPERARLAAEPGDVEGAVEREDAAAAERAMRHLVRTAPRKDVARAVTRLAAAHFLDFGHGLIYATKYLDFLDRTDWEAGEDILGALAYGFVHMTREEVLPDWAAWRRRMERGPEGSADLADLPNLPPGPALDAVLGSERPLVERLDAVSLAAATRLLRFEVAVDRDPTVEEGWLWVTHTLTFVDAVRRALPRCDDATGLRLVAFAAWFAAMHRGLDGPDDRGAWRATLGVPDDLDLARPHLERRILGDHAARAIFFAHEVKTLEAAHAERVATGRDEPVLGAMRYLAYGAQERAVARQVLEAQRLVREGKPPRGRR